MRAERMTMSSTDDQWIWLMRRGRFEEAWSLADAALAATPPRDLERIPRHFQRVWNGSPFEGRRVLVRCYHGLGDTLQFVRFVPRLQSIAASVTLWVQPALMSVLTSMLSQHVMLPLHDGIPAAEWDVDIELMELPHALRARPSAADVPYLRVAPAPIVRDERPLVGLVWRGGDWNPRRSMPVAALAPVLQRRGVRWVVMQHGASDDERRIVDGLKVDGDLLFYARTLRALDLLITIDSMPAHLAGALGVPTWVLLHDDPDWRWMIDRDDSPWYPTVRLFRQRFGGDWNEVVVRVDAALDEWLASDAMLR
jgi:hypothetical protein